MKMKLSDLVKLPNNPRKISKVDMDRLIASVKKFGILEGRPFLVSNRTGENVIIGGNMRYEACKELGIAEVPVNVLEGLSEDDEREIIIRDNVSNGEWDMALLEDEWDAGELAEWGVDINFSIDEPTSEEDDFEEDAETKTDIFVWDLFEIGEHRLLCGDSTNADDVEKLMDWNLADVWHNDPPYGMKKEKEGVIGDNMNFDDLLQFNREWIALQIGHLKPNGSFYCWGTDEPLMDIYSGILKPYAKEQKATFRNLITWDKGDAGAGWVSFMGKDWLRSYPIADEKCLFAMMGVQGFNNNADSYFEGWEPIRAYLAGEAEKVGLNGAKLKEITGVWMYSHWFTKSQWTLIPEEHYHALQNAFKKDYDAFKKDYDELKKDYDELKKAYYDTRAFFDNTHDNMTDVWQFKRHQKDGTEWGHATPKPIPLCSRVIKSSCPKGGLVLDAFLGSGSTMVAAHQLGRKCYGLELSPKYCQTIVDRMLKLDPGLTVKRNGEPCVRKMSKTP